MKAKQQKTSRAKRLGRKKVVLGKTKPRAGIHAEDEAFLPLGTRLNDYQILEPIGSGGFGTVYLARQRSIERDVALKISPHSQGDLDKLQLLDHETIPRVFAGFRTPGRNLHALVMQFIPGATLEQMFEALKSRPEGQMHGREWQELIARIGRGTQPGQVMIADNKLPMAEYSFEEVLMSTGIKLARALQYAHSEGVLHLDIKPSNVLLTTSGKPFLVDFVGAASLSVADLDRVNARNVYTAPEQRSLSSAKNPAKGLEALDARADIYALAKVLEGWIEAGEAAGMKVPSALEWVLKRATASDPAHRFVSAADFATAVESCWEVWSVNRHAPAARKWQLGGKLSRPFFAFTFAFPLLISMTLFSAFFFLANPSDFFLPQDLYLSTVAWVVTTLLVGGVALRLRRWFLNHQEAKPGPLLRRSLLRLPLKVAALVSGLWVIAGLAWVAQYIGIASPGVLAEGYALFFGLPAAAGALTSLLLGLWWSVRVAYPQLWQGQNDIKRTARRELSFVLPTFFLCQLLVLFVGLAGTHYYRHGGRYGQVIHKLYRDFVHRRPAESELRRWEYNFQMARRARVPQACVLTHFFQDPDVTRARVASWLQTYLSRPEPLSSLHTAPEVGRLASAISVGEEPLEALSELLAGDRFFELHGRTVKGLTQGLHEKLLHRRLDPVGAIIWTNTLRKGRNADTVKQLVTSPDSLRYIVAEWYVNFLKFPSTVWEMRNSHEVQVIADLIKTGRNSDEVLAGLLARKEYLGDAAEVATRTPASLEKNLMQNCPTAPTVHRDTPPLPFTSQMLSYYLFALSLSCLAFLALAGKSILRVYIAFTRR